jgi:hypothetical protein
LVFVVFVPLYFDTKQTFFVSEKSDQNPAIQAGYELPNIYNAKIDTSLTPPTVYDALMIRSGRLFVGGKGMANTEVILTIKKETAGDSGGVNFYITSVNSAGEWSIGTDKDNSRLSPGRYGLQVMSYSREANATSSLSPMRSFEIGQDWLGTADRIDVYLNYAVVVFLLLSISSIVLLI